MDKWLILEILLWILLVILLIWIILAPFYSQARWSVWNSACESCDRFCAVQSQIPLVSNKDGMGRLVNPFVKGSWGLALGREGTHVWTTQNTSGMLLNMSLGGAQIGASITIPAGTGTVGFNGFPAGVTIRNQPRCYNKKRCRKQSCGCTCFDNDVSPNTLTGANASQTPAISFPITVAGETAEAEVIVATSDGVLVGYNAALNATQGIIAVDNSVGNTIYKGCIRVLDRLYVCNFYEGKIDVYDANWALVSSFTDPQLITGDTTYAPYNITWDDASQRLYVSFAQQNTAKTEEEPGQGNGFIVVFDLEGGLRKRLVSRGLLNVPAGMAIRGDVLYVANNGSGTIVVYNKCTGAHVGTILSRCGLAKTVEQIHSLAFVPKSAKQRKACCRQGALMFVSAPDQGQDGILGLLVNQR